VIKLIKTTKDHQKRREMKCAATDSVSAHTYVGMHTVLSSGG